MKYRIFAALVLIPSILSVAAVTVPAHAAQRQRGATQDTYCLQGRSYGYPGNCQFSTYEQCIATASGTDSGCGLNPMRAYGYDRGQRGGRYQPY